MDVSCFGCDAWDDRQYGANMAVRLPKNAAGNMVFLFGFSEQKVSRLCKENSARRITGLVFDDTVLPVR